MTFATVRHRTKVTKGPGSKAAGIAMAFKLTDAAQERWRAVNAPQLVALVRAGARNCSRLSGPGHLAASLAAVNLAPLLFLVSRSRIGRRHR